MSGRARIKLMLLRCSVAIVIAVVLFFIVDSWWWRVKRIPYITNGAGIPASGKILGKGPSFRNTLSFPSPDLSTYLVFQCSESDIRKFASLFSKGISIEDWDPSPNGFVRTIYNYSDECPNFDLTRIKNGRYCHVPGISCAIDLDRNIVYVCS